MIYCVHRKLVGLLCTGRDGPAAGRSGGMGSFMGWMGSRKDGIGSCMEGGVGCVAAWGSGPAECTVNVCFIINLTVLLMKFVRLKILLFKKAQ